MDVYLSEIGEVLDQLVPNPDCDILARRVFQALDLVQAMVVEFFIIGFKGRFDV
tara:strand:+ start:798 stop:959 length:162 start_codon:yes stop_codon:yes gene_type:complete